MEIMIWNHPLVATADGIIYRFASESLIKDGKIVRITSLPGQD